MNSPGATVVGLVGLGIMGAPIAGHLLSAGYALRVFSRTKAKADPLLARGARWCDSPAQAADGAELLLTVVTDTPDVEQVLFGEHGAASCLPRGAVVVDLSTIRPDAARSFAERIARQGAAMLDAPVTGGEHGARQATLTIMVGGERSAFERAAPLLHKLASKVVHVGPSGAGQALKACNQILCAVNMMGVCEALLLAQASGIDAALALETLSGGAGGSWAWTHLGAKIAQSDLQPAFMIDLMQKDLRIVQAAAEQSNLPLPAAALAQQLFRAVQREPQGGRLGTQAMIRAYEKLRGA